MRHPAWLLALLTLAVPACARAQTPAMVLTRDGQPTCVIVTAQRPAPPSVAAALDLRRILQKVSGAAVPVRPEDFLTQSELAGPLILVGDSSLARQAGVRVRDLPPEGFVIRTAGNRLILAGKEDRIVGGQFQAGTRHAVAAFAEDVLGVRWLWPGPLGEVIPQRATIALPALDRADAPRLPYRVMLDSLAAQNNPRWDVIRKATAIDDDRLKDLISQSEQWLDRLRLGAGLDLQHNHAFKDWWDEHHLAHPDWFAQHANGSRAWPKDLWPADLAKMCVSNPQVLARFLRDAAGELRGRPGLQSVSATPNDYGHSGHCLCPACEAWDAPDAPSVMLQSAGPGGRLVTLPHPALTDRYVRFYNLAADGLARTAPGAWLAGYAYKAWRSPPVREKVRPNVLIGYVGFSYVSDPSRDRALREWDGWAAVAPRLMLRPNLLHEGDGYPLVYVHRLAEDIRRCYDRRMMAACFDSVNHHWANQGLNMYVLAKLLWNPEADVDALVADYCHAGFGPAAGAVRAYFDALERHTTRVAAAGKTDDVTRLFAFDTLDLYTPQVFGEFQDHLDRAKVDAAGDATVLARLAFLETGLEYARLQAAAVRAVKDSAGRAARSAPAVAARDRFVADHFYSFAIGGPNIVWLQAQQWRRFNGTPRPAIIKEDLGDD